MTQLEQTILREVAELSRDRQENVLAYIRFLKLGLDRDQGAIKSRFEKSWKQVRARAKKLNIGPDDIDNEIRATREGK